MGEGLSEASCHGHGMSRPWGAGRALCTERLLFFQTQAEALPEEQALPLFRKLPSGPWRVRAWTSEKCGPKARDPVPRGMGQVESREADSLPPCLASPSLTAFSVRWGGPRGTLLPWSPVQAVKGESGRVSLDQAGN